MKYQKASSIYILLLDNGFEFMSGFKNMIIQECSFNEVEPIWREKLWLGRKTAIEPVSAINHLGEIEIGLMAMAPIFFKALNKDKIVGVISGFTTSETRFRSRGLWVDEQSRLLGVGRALVDKISAESKNQNRNTLWTMPRLISREFYIKCGFQEYKKVINYEFGPHCLVEKQLT